MKRRLFNIVVCAFALVGLLAAGPTLAHAAEAPWEQSGEIEWQLDNGTLTIRPANGASSGELYDVPWENRKSEITSIVVEDEVICNIGYFFIEYSNLETADVRGMRSNSEHPNPFDFRDCPKLKKSLQAKGSLDMDPTDLATSSLHFFQMAIGKILRTGSYALMAKSLLVWPPHGNYIALRPH